MIHKHVSQLGLPEGYHASSFLILMNQHLTQAPHQVHEGCINERHLLLVTGVAARSPTPLALGKVDDPNDCRLALLIIIVVIARPANATAGSIDLEQTLSSSVSHSESPTWLEFLLPPQTGAWALSN